MKCSDNLCHTRPGARLELAAGIARASPRGQQISDDLESAAG